MPLSGSHHLSQYCEVWSLEKASSFDAFLWQKSLEIWSSPLPLLVLVVGLFFRSFVRLFLFLVVGIVADGDLRL